MTAEAVSESEPDIRSANASKSSVNANVSSSPDEAPVTESVLPSWAVTFGRQAFSSTVGAAVTATVVTPLDVVKVRLQSHVCPVGGHVPCQHPDHVSGSFDALRKIVRSDGIRGLWRGLNVTLLLAIPTTGIYFSLYETIRNHLPISEQQRKGWLATASSGAVARVIAATVASPLELARTSVQAGAQGTVLSVLRDVRQAYGMRAWWRGLGPTLMRDAPFSAIYWSVYETLKNEKSSPFPKRMFRKGNEFITYLMSGIGAGALAAFCTIPADVLKTRKQTSVVSLASQAEANSHYLHRPSTTGAAGTSHGKPAGSSTAALIREIIATEGVRGLYKGVGPRVVKVAPACAIMMGTFETIKRYLGE